MPTSPPDGIRVPERSTLPQDAVVITVMQDGAVRYLLTTEAAGLTATLEDDALDDEARFVIATCINTGWFEFNDLLGYLARLPTDRGAGRAGRRRREREGS